MSVLINDKTKVIVQGITGKHGSFHTQKMLGYGTKIVAGVTPGKGGQEVFGVPVFSSVNSALKNKFASWSVIFVPAPFVKSAAFEALKCGLNIVIITENVPIHDTLEILALASKLKRRVLGPNCPGMIIPGKSKLGIIPAQVCSHGHIGVVSRSGTLTYEVVSQMSRRGLGQSTIVGIGGDPIVGTDFIDVLKMFERDKNTDKIVLIGEIGGSAEERAATYIKEKISKPVVAYVAGRTAPPGKRMGHAGAVVSGNEGTALSKISALRLAGVRVAKLPSRVADLLKKS